MIYNIFDIKKTKWKNSLGFNSFVLHFSWVCPYWENNLLEKGHIWSLNLEA